MPSLSMLNVLPTPGAYPRNSLKIACFFSGAVSSNHCSGVFTMLCIILRRWISLEFNYNSERETTAWKSNSKVCIVRRHCGGDYISLLSVAACQLRDRRIRLFIGGPVHFCKLGFAVRHICRRACYGSLQLLLPATTIPFHYCRSPELDRPVDVFSYGRSGEPAF